MASLNPYRTGNTTATAFTGISRPISIMDNAPGSVAYPIPGDSPYRFRKTVQIIPEGRTGPYGPGQKMRILFPCGRGTNYADIQGTGRLHFDARFQSDQRYPGRGNTGSRIKVSGQGMLGRCLLYMQSNNNLEDFRYYGRVMTMLGKPAATAPGSVYSESSVFEYDISRVVGMTVAVQYDPLSPSGQSIVRYAGASNSSANNWANCTAVHFALPINLGFFCEPVLLPFEHMAAQLILEITWASYQDACLDFSASEAQLYWLNNSGAVAQNDYNVLDLETPSHTYSSPSVSAAAAQLAQNPYSNVTAGTYQVSDCQFEYTEVEVDQTLSQKVYGKIFSAEGLVMHYDSFLYDLKFWTGCSVQLDFADVVKSLKSLFLLNFPANAQTDSWSLAYPEFAGMMSLQFAIATELWPKRPMTKSTEVFGEFNKALGVNNSRLNQRLVGPSEFWPGTALRTNGQGFYISPIHNNSLHNQLPFISPYNGAAGDKNSAIGPTQIVYTDTNDDNYMVAPPTGWDWGVATLTDGTVVIESTAVTITTIGTQDADLGSVILLQICSNSGTRSPLTQPASLFLTDIEAGTSFTVDSSSDTDARTFFWLVMPRPAGQTRSVMISGLNTPAFFANTLTTNPTRCTFFTNLGQSTDGYNMVVASPSRAGGSPVVAINNPGASPVVPMVYACMSETINAGSGPVVFSISIPAADFNLDSTNGVYYTYIPLPPGIPLTAGTVAFVTPVGASTDAGFNTALNQTNGNWQELLQIYVNYGAAVPYIELRMPVWALNTNTLNGTTNWNVAVADVQYFGNGGVSANSVNNWLNFLNTCNAQRGQWAFQWGVTQLLPYGPISGVTQSGDQQVPVPYMPPGGTPCVNWFKHYMAMGMLFEAESNPATISGADLNPNKHVFVYMIRSDQAATAYNFYNPNANGAPVVPDVYWNGGNIANAGGFPNMNTEAFFLHDRKVTLQSGIMGLVVF